MNISRSLSMTKLLDYWGDINEDNEQDVLAHLENQVDTEKCNVILFECSVVSMFRSYEYVEKNWDKIWRMFIADIYA
jgi:hypothetical protein